MPSQACDFIAGFFISKNQGCKSARLNIPIIAISSFWGRKKGVSTLFGISGQVLLPPQTNTTHHE
jgi:hypothetical protein